MPRILVVEDEALVRMGIRHSLEGIGHEVLEASCAEDALRLLHETERPVQLLIADLFLPGYSGSELAGQLRGERTEIPSIFISAHPRDLAVRKGWIAPDARLLQKPFANEDLVALVGKIIG